MDRPDPRRDGAEPMRSARVALRSVVSADRTVADHPGRLREALQAQLSAEEFARLRRPLHQVVVAAEEHVPASLTRWAPVTDASRQRIAADLAQARGWTAEAALNVTDAWASALGLQVADADLQRPAPGPAPQPRVDELAATELPKVGLAATELPPDALVSTGPPAARPVAWPSSPRRHLSQLGDRPDVVATTVAYRGMSFVVFVAAIVALTVVLCLPVILFGGAGFLLPAIGAIGAMLLVKRLGMGLLVATATGLEFVPLDGPGRTPRVEGTLAAPWTEVEVAPAWVSIVTVGENRVQVGPRHRDFVAAAAARAGDAS